MADCPAAPLSKPSIWPARAPVAVHSGVWGVVSLSAIAAMDHGRRLMYALRLWPPPPTPLHITASRSPVTRFWVLVTEFDTLRCAPLLSYGLPGLTCLPSVPLCVSLFLPLSGYPAPFAPSAAGALCWLLFPCLAGRSFELLCPRAGCCWPRVGAPGRFLLVWHSCPSLHNACIMQHHPFFFPILPSQQMSLHRCFCGG